MCALVQASVHCRLDYCNSLLTGAANVHFKCLQSVQNATTRLVSGARHHDHITPVLTTLHWLPVHKRVMFKTVVLKCLNNTAPDYLSKLCIPVASASGHQHLRSASTGILQVPRARTMIGWWSFATAGPSLWKSLHAALRRQEMALQTFKQQLKVYLFHIGSAGEQKEHSPPPGTIVAFS